jgi:mannose-6-phosphate isomerase-like protein (cupin superfamily)
MPGTLTPMAEYTRKNLRSDVDDQADAFGFSPDLEFRVARDALETKHCALSFMRVGPGFRVPFGHHHDEQEEVYVLVHGSARLKLDDDVLDLEAWDAVRIAPGVVRDVEGGPGGAELILFGAPRVGSGDAVLTQGWWTD